ncbi:uncharacterized protein LOC129321798 isoform X3 [Prosopis cineraria]|uniref:uncharacterized protein LOC129321798 isoform X3 n=1 Tax=Prosopis cineraria TaxID=364024 RepID=UPI0024103E5B|nr:uncharacterized protein LOC129321798 isoform X3 [Prosopis cineraria]
MCRPSTVSRSSLSILRMLQRWSKAITHVSKIGSQSNLKFGKVICAITRRSYAKVAAASSPTSTDSKEKDFTNESKVNLDKMFWSKPCSLALAENSLLRVQEPKFEGIKRFFLKMLLFYSKQSKSIRGANVVYQRILSQVDKPPIYEDGKEGVEFGQYIYEIYNHDVELRVSKAGVNLLLTRWMKDLEKIFYGNIVAYDTALLPEAKPNDFSDVIWRNIFSDDSSSSPDAAALRSVQAMARYARREVSCLSLTDKEAIYSGNFLFTSLKREITSAKQHQ